MKRSTGERFAVIVKNKLNRMRRKQHLNNNELQDYANKINHLRAK